MLGALGHGLRLSWSDVADRFPRGIDVIVLAVGILREVFLVVILSHVLGLLLLGAAVPEIGGPLDGVVVSLLELAIGSNDSGAAQPPSVDPTALTHAFSVGDSASAVHIVSFIQVLLPHVELHHLRLLRTTLKSLFLPIIAFCMLLPGLLGERALSLRQSTEKLAILGINLFLASLHLWPLRNDHFAGLLQHLAASKSFLLIDRHHPTLSMFNELLNR